MPTQGEDIWFCDHVANGPWPFLLLGLPLVGAYLYGRQRQKLALILIGAWIAFQVPFMFAKTILFQCDAPIEALGGEGQGEGGLPSAEPPGSVAPEQPSPAAPETK